MLLVLRFAQVPVEEHANDSAFGDKNLPVAPGGKVQHKALRTEKLSNKQRLLVHAPCCRCLQRTDQSVIMSGKGAKGLSGKGAKGTMGDKKGDKKKPVSRSARAGLQFPVGRIHRLLKVVCSYSVAIPTQGDCLLLLLHQRLGSS